MPSERGLFFLVLNDNGHICNMIYAIHGHSVALFFDDILRVSESHGDPRALGIDIHSHLKTLGQSGCFLWPLAIYFQLRN